MNKVQAGSPRHSPPLFQVFSLAVCSLSLPAHATDYLQCREMKNALARVEVDGIQFAEGRFRDSLGPMGMDQVCGIGWGGSYSVYSTWEGLRRCHNDWITSRYKLQGFDWKGNAIYNPAAEYQFKKARKIRKDMQKEGCP